MKIKLALLILLSTLFIGQTAFTESIDSKTYSKLYYNLKISNNFTIENVRKMDSLGSNFFLLNLSLFYDTKESQYKNIITNGELLFYSLVNINTRKQLVNFSNKDSQVSKYLRGAIEDRVYRYFSKNYQNSDFKINVDTIAPINLLNNFNLLLVNIKYKEEDYLSFKVLSDGNWIAPDGILINQNISIINLFEYNNPLEQIDYANTTLLSGNSRNINKVIFVVNFLDPYCKTVYNLYIKRLLEGQNIDVYLVNRPDLKSDRSILLSEIYAASVIMKRDILDYLFSKDILKLEEESETLEFFAKRLQSESEFLKIYNSEEVKVFLKNQRDFVDNYNIKSTPSIFINKHLINGYKPSLIDYGFKTDSIIIQNNTRN